MIPTKLRGTMTVTGANGSLPLVLVTISVRRLSAGVPYGTGWMSIGTCVRLVTPYDTKPPYDTKHCPVLARAQIWALVGIGS